MNTMKTLLTLFTAVLLTATAFGQGGGFDAQSNIVCKLSRNNNCIN